MSKNEGPDKYIQINDENISVQKIYLSKQTIKKWTFTILVILACLIFGVFIIIFIIVPIIVKYSFYLQQSLVFTHCDLPSKQEFFAEYHFPAYRNLYVPVKDAKEATKHVLGVWHILPVEIATAALNKSDFDYDKALANSKYDVLVYFHGTGEARSNSARKYQLLSYYFHVIAFDYRDYADSSKGILTESGVVNDCVQLYYWLQNKTQSDIYFWGHSLGSSIAANTAAILESANIHIKGLILESAFTSFEEELYVHPYTKMFAWLPWFYITIVKPLHDNGFVFDTASYLKNTSCSVMILHAEDDSVIPYRFGKKLFSIAKNRTESSTTVYYQFDKKLEYDHYFIYQDPFLKYYIMKFIRKTINILPAALQQP